MTFRHGRNQVWTISATSLGTVLSLHAYRNVNTSDVVDADSGASTASSLSHAAPTVSVSTGIALTTFHALRSSATWTPPSGMTELTDRMSHTLGSSGVSMEVNLLFLSSAGNTSSTTATASSSADIGLTQSLVLNGLYLISNTAPVLDSTKTPALFTVQQNSGAPSGSVGTLVSTLVDFKIPAGQVDNITDPDNAAQLGIALTHVDTSEGSWFYTVNGGVSWQSIGSVSQSNARLLAADNNTRIYFQPSSGYSGTLASAITFYAWDQTSSSNGSLASALPNSPGTAFSENTDTAQITVQAINQAPSATNLSASEVYTEDTALDFVDMVVSDADSSNVTVTLTLSDASMGVLSTSTSGAVTSTYNASTGVWVASGAVADVNVLLSHVQFVPSLNATGNVVIATSVTDGVASAVTGSKTCVGVAVNDAPSATNLSASEVYTEDTALNLVDVVVSDADSSNVTVTLTLSDASMGALSVGTSGAVTSTYNASTGVWLASGALVDVNVLLAHVQFVPSLNTTGNVVIATSVTDGVASAVTGSKTCVGVAVNDAPSATNLSAAEVYTEDTALDLVDVVVLDVDSSNVTVTLTLSDASAGILSAEPSDESLLYEYNTETGVWQVSGDVEDVNTLLGNMVFIPASDYDENLTLSVSISDGTADALEGIKTLRATPVNDPPSVTNISVSESYLENTPLNLMDFYIADIDSDNVSVECVFSDLNAGTLVSDEVLGVVFENIPETGRWRAQGLIADVNRAIQSLTYQPQTGFKEAFALFVVVSDGTDSVSGEKSFTGAPLEEEPIEDPTENPDEDPSGTPSGNNGSVANSSDEDTQNNPNPSVENMESASHAKRGGCNCSDKETPLGGEGLLFLAGFLWMRRKKRMMYFSYQHL